jgi:hypothetical protein
MLGSYQPRPLLRLVRVDDGELPKKEECVAMKVDSSICANPLNAPTILSII